MLLAISSSPAFVARPAVSLRAFRAAGRRPSDPRRRDKQTTSPPAAAVASAAWPPEERQEGRRPGSGSPARQVQRALGLDYGRRVVGLAVSTLGLAPRPLEGLPGCGLDGQVALAAAVLEIARRESCDAVVVGLPVTQAGSLRKRDTDSQQGRRCRNFALNLAAAAEGPAGGSGGNGGSSIRVFLADERGSTLEARHVLASSGRRSSAFGKVKDSVAAAVILDTFFQDPGAAMLVRPYRDQSRTAGGGSGGRQQQMGQQQQGQQKRLEQQKGLPEGWSEPPEPAPPAEQPGPGAPVELAPRPAKPCSADI